MGGGRSNMRTGGAKGGVRREGKNICFPGARLYGKTYKKKGLGGTLRGGRGKRGVWVVQIWICGEARGKVAVWGKKWEGQALQEV